MTKNIYLTFALLLTTTIAVSAQSLVSSTPQKRVAVLEEFTGINCGWCPAGHAISDSLAALYGDRYVAVNIHAGGFAQPSGSQPDFRIDAGVAIDAEMQPSGYPNGTVNRTALNGEDFSVGRNSWAGAVQEILQMDSPVNVGMKSDFDDETRELTVQVDAYYTSDMDSSSFINIAFIESGIIAPQIDNTNGNTSTYTHNHMLRAMITDTWGDEVMPTSAGLVSRTYTYTVPEEFVIESSKVVAFVTENRKNTYSGASVDANGGATSVVAQLSGTQVNQYAAGTIGEFNTYNYTIQNTSGENDSYTVTFDTDAPDEWESVLMFNGEVLDGDLTLAADEIANILVEVRPCTTPGLATYTLSFQSAIPDADAITQEVYIISGIKDLIVSNADADIWSSIYDDGLTAQNHIFKGSTDVVAYKAFSKAGALEDINNLFFNVSWTFPAFTESTVVELQKFIDGGGNLLIAGQDIGWDNSGVDASNGTPFTQDFYANYLQADYINDGSSANASVSGITGDIFADIPMSDIADVFEGNTYPEVIAPLGTATPIFYYNDDTDLVGGIKGTIGDAKIIYLGIGLEQLENVETANAMMGAAFDWFYEGVDIDTELMECFAVGIENIEVSNLMQNIYPNPSTDFVIVPFDALTESAQLSVYSHDGRLIAQRQIPANSPQLKLSTAEFSNGLYMVNLITTDGKTQTKQFLIQK